MRSSASSKGAAGKLRSWSKKRPKFLDGGAEKRLKPDVRTKLQEPAGAVQE